MRSDRAQYQIDRGMAGALVARLRVAVYRLQSSGHHSQRVLVERFTDHLIILTACFAHLTRHLLETHHPDLILTLDWIDPETA